MEGFSYEGLPGRVVFGRGNLANLAQEVTHLGCRRVLLVVSGSASRYEAQVITGLGELYAASFSEVVQHVPLESATAAQRAAREARADGVVTLGGGSAVGLGKVIALEMGLPVIAVPTTFSGSEMTPIYGITNGGRKRTGRDLRVLPRTVIYDPALVFSMPTELAANSGMNALAHCVEALYAQTANPITSLMAQEGAQALAAGLPRIVQATSDQAEREGGYEQALYGAWLAGTVLGSTGTALHHRTCHVLGGTFNLPHAHVNATVLPYATAYNAPTTPQAMRRLAQALGVSEAVAGLFELGERLGTPTSLALLGLNEAELDRATELILDPPFWNPRPLDRTTIRQMLQDAFEGKPPAF